jgi:hypothetical protein
MTFKDYLEEKQFPAIKTEQQYEVLFGLDSRWHVVDSKLKAIDLFAFPYEHQANDMAAALNRGHRSCTQESHESKTQA